ncbi:MAG: ATP-binding protein, partial [Chlamydiota bacterium]
AYPVVTITGPRQSGKTTLVKEVFPHLPYFNLEAPDIREYAEKDPRGFLNQSRHGMIIDEIQQVPNLFSYIQVLVDEHDIKGEFILTGSHKLGLHQGISQSLAGRVALLSLLPMSLSELSDAGFKDSLDDFMIKGGYPRIFKDGLNPLKTYRNYHQTYLEKDLRQLINIKDLSQFQRFIKLCAGRIGQLLNLSSLANDLGVSATTIEHWISLLEASYLVILLQPYFENFGKRSIKSPKLYFTDVGLACYLLGIETPEQLSRDPLKGALFENLVFLELYKARSNQGLDPHLYFYRDHKGFEIDFIFEQGRRLTPIEVKSSQTFNLNFSKNILTFQTLAKEKFDRGYVIYTGDREFSMEDVSIVNYENVSKIITCDDYLKTL